MSERLQEGDEGLGVLLAQPLFMPRRVDPEDIRQGPGPAVVEVRGRPAHSPQRRRVIQLGLGGILANPAVSSGSGRVSRRCMAFGAIS